MIKPYRDKLPWLLLPIESKARELDAKVLLACFAAEAGYGVIIGNHAYLDDLLRHLPRGIFFDKATSLSNSQIKKIEYIRKLGNVYVCLDEEGLVYDEHMYFRNRVNKQNLDKITIFFTWGEEQAKNIISRFPQFASKIMVTGNPRVDLWRSKLRKYFHDRVSKLQSTYGPYILIASNFASVNYFHKLAFVLNQRRKEGIVRSLEDEEYLKNRYQYKLQLFRKFLELIVTLNKTFPSHKIIIRPHPAEKHDLWEKTAKGLANVKVVYEDSVTPWILGADALIHNSCMTGIEASLVGVPVIAYRPYVSERFDSFLPNSISKEVFNLDFLIDLLQDTIDKKRLKRSEDLTNIDNILKKHIAALDGSFASERIIDNLKRIKTEKQPLFFGPPQILFMTSKLKRFIKNITKETILESPRFIRKFLNQERTNAWENQKKVFPKTNTNEIQNIIQNISRTLSRFYRVRTFPISTNCFYIVNDI